jgi:predicted TPR repeat methyltransferase
MTASLIHSSGDLIADRRYAFGRDLAVRGDLAAAADLFAQAVELAPNFTSAWFALGEARDKLGHTADAIAAFRQAQVLDPQDHHGASLYLIRLEASPLHEMPADYVRTLFDQYAPRFDAALVEGLMYRGPELLLGAVRAACAAAGRAPRFGAALDLGCGTGLGGAAFRPVAGTLAGVDISPKMVEQAQAKGIYDHFAVGDIGPYLREQPADTYDLVFAADVFAYFAELAPLATASARVLKPGGLLAFSVETHAANDVILGASLRYAHGAAHVRAALSQARLSLLRLDPASTRNEGTKPVPGLIAIATRE